MSKSALHYTKIGDAGGVPLQRCEPSMSCQKSGQHIILNSTGQNTRPSGSLRYGRVNIFGVSR